MVICVLRVSLTIVSPCPRVSACQSSDTWDIRDILDFNDSGSLSKLTCCGCDEYGDEGEPVTIDTTMTEADFSGKGLGAVGAQILAAFMSTKLFEAKGSLSKLKMDRYELPIQEIKTATELDLSGKGLGDLDAIVIAALIKVQTIAQNDLVTN